MRRFRYLYRPSIQWATLIELHRASLADVIDAFDEYSVRQCDAEPVESLPTLAASEPSAATPERRVQTSTRFHKRRKIAKLVSDRIIDQRPELLRESFVDYRIRAIGSVSPLVLAIALQLLVAAIAGQHTPGSPIYWWLRAVAFALYFLSFACALYFLWKLKGRLISDSLSEKWRNRIRRNRMPKSQFRFVIQTRTSEILNTHADPGKLESIKPQLEYAARSVDTLNPTRALAEIRDRALARPIVLGVTGSRGVGKTTALDYLRRFEAEVGAIVLLRLPAPSIKADLSKFVLEAVAQKLGTQRPPSAYARSQRWAAIFFWILIALVVTTITLWSISERAHGDRPDQQVPAAATFEVFADWVATAPIVLYALLGVLLCVVMTGALISAVVATIPKGKGYARAMADDILERLRFDHEIARQATLGLSRTGSGGLSRQLTKKSKTFAQGDAYASFENLVQCYQRATGKRLMLLIDELDRYEYGDTEGALSRALNELKPFFLVPGVSTVMSVSTEAATNFSRRSTRQLDVLDSTFDEVVTMPMWTDEEMRTFLSYLVVGLSKRACATLAHRSYGRPREAIRLAWLFCQLCKGKCPSELRDGAIEKIVEPAELTQHKCIQVITSYLDRLASEAASTSTEKSNDRARAAIAVRWAGLFQMQAPLRWPSRGRSEPNGELKTSSPRGEGGDRQGDDGGTD